MMPDPIRLRNGLCRFGWLSAPWQGIYNNLVLQQSPPSWILAVPSLTIENYVKTIYLISTRQQEQPVATGQLADALGVSPGTVTSMAKTLSETGLAEYKPYGGLHLSRSGRRLAMRIIRRHRLIETFLVQTLKLSWDEVHDEAENMEHAVSDLLIDRIDEFLGFPTSDPHGDPIPTADGTIIPSEGVSLDQLSPGTTFRLVRVLDQTSGFLQDLSRDGLSIESEGVVRQNEGSFTVEIGEKQLTLAPERASKLLVQVVVPRQSASARGPA